MKKIIGKVSLDYSFYTGNDEYSDGMIEDVILRAVQSGKQEELLYNSHEWAVLYHLSDYRQNLLAWYPFKESDSILEIGSGCGALTNLFSKKAAKVTCIELSKKRSLINAYRNQNCENINIVIGNFQDIKIKEKYDYITLIGVLEYAGLYIDGQEPYLEMIKLLQQYLKPNGRIIIAIENKMGLKYWNGAPEDHTGKMYSGLNDYISEQQVRTFSKPEMERLLHAAGIFQYDFYYPLPDYKLPEVIYSEKILPEPTEIKGYRKNYNSDRLYNFYEDTVIDQLCQDKVFPYFSNSFLLITGKAEQVPTYVKYSQSRRLEYQSSTIIVKEDERKIVKKIALNKQAEKHIEKLKYNEQIWHSVLSGITCITGEYQRGCYLMPYIEGINVDVYLFPWRNDCNQFINKILEIIQKYLTPTNEQLHLFEYTDEYIRIFGNVVTDNAQCLPVTNIDMTFSNMKFAKTGEIYIFDNEWVFDFPIPYEYVLWRCFSQLYTKYIVYLREKIKRDDFLSTLGIHSENLSIYKQMEYNFNLYVSGYSDIINYLNNYRKKGILQTIKFV